MPAELEEIRRRGYSDQEIAERLAQSKGMDIAEIRRRGYSDTEIAERFLYGAQAAPSPTPQRGGLGRQLGLTVRHGLEGAAGALGIAADPIGTTLGAVTGRPYQPLQQTVSSGLTRLGVPEAETPAERVVGGASRSLAGAGAFVRGGNFLAQQAQPTMRAVGNFLQQSPRLQAASATSGGGAAELARESGAGPGGQIAAGVLGGFAPGFGPAGTAAAVRGGFRGGEAGRQRVVENLRTFETAGTTPTVGQATEGRIARASESVLSRTPGAAGVMARRAEDQAEEIGAGLEAAASRLSRSTTAAQAGASVERGAGAFVDKFKAQSRALYNELDAHIPAQSPINLRNTSVVLDELSRPIPGAAATSQALANPKLSGIRQALQEDMTAGSGALPYEAVKALRTRVGEMLTDSALVSDVPRAQVKRLYAALTQDVQAAASRSPEAMRALNRANNYYKAGMNRLEVLERVIDKNGGPEAVFKAATSGTKEGAFVLRSVMQSLPKENQRDLAAAIVRRLGMAKASVQDQTGEVFSTQTFLTNWNNLSKEAKAVVFNRFGPQFARDMDDISKVAANLRAGSKVYANPSGTGGAAAQFGTVGAFVMSILTGQLQVAGGIAAAAGGANAAARRMTNPNFVRWLAQSTKAPIGTLNQQAVVLQNIAQREGDQEMAEFAATLKEQAVNNQGQ
jgi:hypothetical protein